MAHQAAERAQELHTFLSRLVDRAQSGREDEAVVIHDEARLGQRRAFEGWAAARHGRFAQGDDGSGDSGSDSASDDDEDMFLEDDKDMTGVRCRMQMCTPIPRA
jgi:hypothetical protein